VFTAADGELLYETLMTATTTNDRAGFRSPPPLLALLAWTQERPPYVDVVVDRSGADLTFCAGAAEPVHRTSVLGSDDEIERNAPGGWSQPRYQQRAEDSWRHNAGQVADAVSRQVTAISAQDLLHRYAFSRIQRHGAAVADRANESTSGVICVQVPKLFDRSLPGRSALPARLPVLSSGSGSATCRSPWRETWGRIWC